MNWIKYMIDDKLYKIKIQQIQEGGRRDNIDIKKFKNKKYKKQKHKTYI